MRTLSLIGVVAALLALPSVASARICNGLPAGAQLSIHHPQSNIYDVHATQQSNGVSYQFIVFYGCDLHNGRVTKLLTDGNNFSDYYVVSHNVHATVLEDSINATGGVDPYLVTIWNLASGRADATDRFSTSKVINVIDSPQGQEVTAIVYRQSGHAVLDAVSSKGLFHLSKSASHVTVSGRTVTWTSSGGSHSRTV